MSIREGIRGNINLLNNERNSSYRPEIDGLRAFAVIAVIINHFNKSILPGGYLGVDIFFVISGYVITSSLFERPSKNFRDFIIGFYTRRIKRLVPALSFFVVISSAAICLFNPSPEVSLRTGISSLFGLSNIYLLRQSTDYFATATELNVFTHTWSLGVEEQFYVLFPFLIWFSGFGRQSKNGFRNLFFIVSSLTIASVIGFIYLYYTSQPTAYFSMPSRFWEMASGCLTFLGLKKVSSIEQIIFKIKPLFVFILIVGVMFLPMSLATISTFIIVTLSSLLIIILRKESWLYKIFTNSSVIYIGLISYSLYLWHWGILSISRWTIGIHWWSIPFQVALMLSLAVISYKFIESPIRKGKWFIKKWNTLLIGAGIIASVSTIIITLDKTLKDFIYLGSVKDSNKSDLDNTILPNSAFAESISWKLIKENKTALSTCPENLIKIKNEKQKIFFIGDSHTNHLTELIGQTSNCLREVAYAHGGGARFPVVRWTHPKYMTIEDIEFRNNSLNGAYNKAIQKMRAGDLLVLSSSVHILFDQDNNDFPRTVFYSDNTKISRKEAGSLWIRNLDRIAKNLEEKGINLVVFMPLPYFGISNTQPVAGQCSREWFNYLRKVDPSCPQEFPFIKRDIFNRKFKNFEDEVKKIAGKRQNLFIFNTLNTFCDQTNYCKAYQNKGSDKIFFKDDDHLSPEGSSLLGKNFLNWLNKNSLVTF